MDWNAVGALGQVLGSFAVFVTLAYLAVQVRHARRVPLLDLRRLWKGIGRARVVRLRARTVPRHARRTAGSVRGPAPRRPISTRSVGLGSGRATERVMCDRNDFVDDGDSVRHGKIRVEIRVRDCVGARGDARKLRLMKSHRNRPSLHEETPAEAGV